MNTFLYKIVEVKMSLYSFNLLFYKTRKTLNVTKEAKKINKRVEPNHVFKHVKYSEF